MRLDGKLADRRGRIEPATEKGKSSSKKSKRRQKKPLKAVQRLFDTCKKVFANGGAGTIPSQEDVRRLSSILGVRLAKVKMDAVLNAPCETSILYPASGGNMHRFTAVTSCAVLDVLGPPYSTPEGRVCTYYDDFPYSNFPGGTVLHGEVDGYAWLKARAEKPDDFTVGSAEYKGPKIVKK